VGVETLARPGYLIEVDAIAVIDADARQCSPDTPDSLDDHVGDTSLIAGWLMRPDPDQSPAIPIAAVVQFVGSTTTHQSKP